MGGGGKERLTFLSILTSSYTFIDYVLSLSSSIVSPLKTKSLIFPVVHFHQSYLVFLCLAYTVRFLMQTTLLVPGCLVALSNFFP